MKHMVQGLQKAKEDGLVKNIGVSIYDEPEALQAVELGVDYVQVPYNVFDQRLDATDFFDIAKKNNVTVFARSPFLKGLLLLKPDKLPEHLKYLYPYLEKFISIAQEYQFTPTEAALYFVSESCRAKYIVFGIDTLEQLVQNIDIINLPISNEKDSFIVKIKECFKDLNRGAINPSLWNKIKL
jgi:aryl-alcohol dehydrogenase-like predicted oxidoreductase